MVSIPALQVALRYLGPGHGVQLGELAHLVHIDSKIRTCADKTIRILRREAVFGDQPVYEVDGCRFHGYFQWTIGIY